MRASLRSSTLGRDAPEPTTPGAAPAVAWQQLAWLRSAGAVVAGIVCVMLVFHFVWLVRFRRGYVTEWDEAGYMQFALSNFDALHDDGLWTFAKTVGGRETFGPLLPFVISLAYPIVGRGVFGSLLVLPLFFCAGWSPRAFALSSPAGLRLLGGGRGARGRGDAGGHRLHEALSLRASGDGVYDSRVVGAGAVGGVPPWRLGRRLRRRSSR